MYTNGVDPKIPTARRRARFLGLGNQSYGTVGWAADMVRFLADHLLLAHLRAACLRPLSRVELAIAQVKTCSDFRLASVEIHKRTGHPPKW